MVFSLDVGDSLTLNLVRAQEFDSGSGTDDCEEANPTPFVDGILSVRSPATVALLAAGLVGLAASSGRAHP